MYKTVYMYMYASDSVGGYCEEAGECFCNFGYAGQNCDIGKTAVYIGSEGNLSFYTCGTSPSLLGPRIHCALAVHYPDLYPCQRQIPCENGATCINNGFGDYLCQCEIGYNGDDCETEINECDVNPCQNGGTCIVSYE